MRVAQSCLTLCNPMDYGVHGILQARILEGEPFPSPGDLPNPGIESRSPALQVDSLPAELLCYKSHFIPSILSYDREIFLSGLVSFITISRAMT